MIIKERTLRIPRQQASDHGLLGYLHQCIDGRCRKNEFPIRFAISQSSDHYYLCEMGVVLDASSDVRTRSSQLFQFRRRNPETTASFNAVLLVPTGIGASIGGHAGDAAAVAALVAQACDRLLIHPNVVNASDINEMPANSLYVEGSILTRLLMGTVALQPVRQNRVLVMLDDHLDKHFVDAAINSVSAGRVTYGLDCAAVVCIEPKLQMFAEYSESGRAVGTIKGMDYVLGVLDDFVGDFDALALSSVIRVPLEYHQEYFRAEGEMVNPWGGVEAMLTHAISSVFSVPAAHAPMFESKKIENLETGIVEPRMAAEAVSLSFIQCVLKGLHRSPRIIHDQSVFGRSDIVSAEDVSCLIIPDGCLGLPTIAALEQGIPVISVRENRNLMRNDLTQLPWQKGQFIEVENYLEAVGVINAMKAGVALSAVRRPIDATHVHRSSSVAAGSSHADSRKVISS